MKRLLSWVVVAVLTVVFYYAEFYVWLFADRILLRIMNFSEALFWVLVVVEGLTVLGFVIVGIVMVSTGVCAASEAISPSATGTRYIVFGVISALIWGAFFVILALLDRAGTISGRRLHVYFAYASMVVYGVVLALIGHGKKK